MLRAVVVVVVLIAACGTVRAQGIYTAALAGKSASAEPEATPPTTAPAANDDAAARLDGSESAADEPSGMISQIATGKKQLTVAEVVNPEFWRGVLTEVAVGALAFVPRIVVAFVCLCVFYLIYRFIRRIVIGSMNRANVDQSIKDMLGSLIKWSVMGFGIVIACNQVGVQITALLTGVSIIGLAVGFAAQETLANFIAGIVIFWDRPFKVGDWIEVDGVFAQVLRITFRSTRMLNGNGETIILPNTSMLSNKLANHTTNPINRVNVQIGIAYKESIAAARAVLIGLTDGDSRICPDPPPCVVVESCGESSVNLILRFWIMDESIEFLIRYEYLERAKNALDEANIQIPFPHMQLFLENTPALTSVGRSPAEPRRLSA